MGAAETPYKRLPAFPRQAQTLLTTREPATADWDIDGFGRRGPADKRGMAGQQSYRTIGGEESEVILANQLLLEQIPQLKDFSLQCDTMRFSFQTVEGGLAACECA